MYSGELEVQAKRKAIAVLQDEINRILNASRELSQLPEMMMKKDKTGIKNTLEQISTIEEEVENLRRKITREVADVGLRRKITREVADVGGLIMNRENLLNTAYTMDEIAGYITGISFKLSNVKPATLKSSKLDGDITKLIELVVDQVYKLNEIIRSLSTNTASAIELAQETQTIEREIDLKYRQATLKLLTEVTNTKELMLMKDVIEGIEEMADKCQRVSDSFILLALSL
jgi:predicted phosphate transport protein (TIGR00153 family)